MRETFTTLQALAHNATQTLSTDTTVATFLKNEINRAYRLTQSELDNFTTQVVKTTTTVADQQYYHKPNDVVTIESIVITINGVDYTLEPIQSQRTWDELRSLTFSGSAFPTHFFQRQKDIGIFPAPQDAYTMTMTYVPRHPDLTAEDYTTGTISVTNNSSTVEGSGTTFTAAMVGRYLRVTADGEWYRIGSYTSATEIALENVYQGTTSTGEAYTIGQSPELPEELHDILAYRAAEMYFLQKKKNPDQSMVWGNMFWTGDPQNSSRRLDSAASGLLAAKVKYFSRASTGIVKRRPKSKIDLEINKLWSTSISS